MSVFVRGRRCLVLAALGTVMRGTLAGHLEAFGGGITPRIAADLAEGVSVGMLHMYFLRPDNSKKAGGGLWNNRGVATRVYQRTDFPEGAGVSVFVVFLRPTSLCLELSGQCVGQCVGHAHVWRFPAGRT
jgi:hypothetical protein